MKIITKKNKFFLLIMLLFLAFCFMFNKSEKKKDFTSNLVVKTDNYDSTSYSKVNFNIHSFEYCKSGFTVTEGGRTHISDSVDMYVTSFSATCNDDKKTLTAECVDAGGDNAKGNFSISQVFTIASPLGKMGMTMSDKKYGDPANTIAVRIVGSMANSIKPLSCGSLASSGDQNACTFFNVLRSAYSSKKDLKSITFSDANDNVYLASNKWWKGTGANVWGGLSSSNFITQTEDIIAGYNSPGSPSNTVGVQLNKNDVTFDDKGCDGDICKGTFLIKNAYFAKKDNNTMPTLEYTINSKDIKVVSATPSKGVYISYNFTIDIEYKSTAAKDLAKDDAIVLKIKMPDVYWSALLSGGTKSMQQIFVHTKDTFDFEIGLSAEVPDSDCKDLIGQNEKTIIDAKDDTSFANVLKIFEDKTE